MKSKKICFFHPSSDLYGSDKIFLNFLSSFEGYDITVVLRVEGPLLEKIRQKKEIRVLVLPEVPILARKFLTPKGVLLFMRNIIYFAYIWRRNHLEDNDVMYINTIASIPVLVFCGSRHKKIVHLHETLDTNNFFYKSIIKFVVCRANWLICVSDAVINPIKNVVRSKYHVKIKRLYNGVDLENTSEGKCEIEIDNTKINMALIGRIKPNMKGQNFLVDAVSLLSEDLRRKIVVHIVGSTVSGQEYMFDRLQEYIISKDLSDCIKISPFVTNIASLYLNIDVVLVPSLCEDSLPTTVLEAMYFSKPVIATVSGGIPEMVCDKYSGLLVDKYDVEGLRDAIASMILDVNKNRLMGQNGRSLFDIKFTKSIFNKNYSELLGDIL